MNSAREYKLSSDTTIFVDNMCMLTFPCQHNAHVVIPNGTDTFLLTALQICELFGRNCIEPPAHNNEQLQKIEQRAGKQWEHKANLTQKVPM